LPHSAKIVADSVNQWGNRLTTFEVVIPRIILAEWNTHRMFTRNSASSRAIPVKKMLDMVANNPYVPTTWGKNQKGMQAAEEILGEDALASERSWLRARDWAMQEANMLMEIGVHKQTANRLLEPFMWHTIINSATEMSNFYGLRDDKMAHPDIQITAGLMRDVTKQSEPKLLKYDQWHLPLVTQDEWTVAHERSAELRELIAICTGRCARVSYLTHEGKRDPNEDVRLHDGLLGNGHMSPLEHAARPMNTVEYHDYFSQPKMLWYPEHGRFIQEQNAKGANVYTHFLGNYQGWIQYRKLINHEEDYGSYLKGIQTQRGTQGSSQSA
jgi:thymidylate synthase ThyX